MRSFISAKASLIYSQKILLDLILYVLEDLTNHLQMSLLSLQSFEQLGPARPALPLLSLELQKINTVKPFLVATSIKQPAYLRQVLA